MTLRRFVKKLPGVLQTEVQKEFYAATFDQVFNPANVESAQGFIGRRTSDVLDPTTDNYIEEPTKNRASYQLEPIAYAVNSALQDTNQLFYEDLINYIKHKGGNIANHDRLFADDYYSFAPPIDVDKYLNYQNYLWLPGDGSDPTNTAPIAFVSAADDNLSPADMDAIIEGTYDPASVGAAKPIIGSSTYNTSEAVYQEQQLLSPRNFEFTSGIRVQFVGSASYNKPFYIEGVGRAVRLVAEEEVVYRSDTVDIVEGSPAEPTPTSTVQQDLLATPDYITIERGSVEGSAWSRSNRWFHEDAVDTLTQLGQLQGGTIIQGGNGYSVGDVLLVTDGDGVNGSFVVTSISLGGVIDGIAVFTRGEGYTYAYVDETGVPSPVSELQWDNNDPFGLGSAWDPDNIITNPSGFLTTLGQTEADFDNTVIGGSVAIGGIGYTVGDTLTVVDPSTEYSVEPTFNVDSVDAATGAVTGISIISSGTSGAIPLTPAVSTTVSPSGGTGCTINLSVNGTFTDGSVYVADDANGASAYPSGLTFANGANATITRTDGATFTSDSITAGQILLVANAGTNNGYYTIDSVTDTVITLVAGESFDTTGTIGAATLRHLDTITMSDGTLVRVDTVDAGGEVLTFTIIRSSTSILPASGSVLTQSSTTGSGVGFVLNLSTANERGVTLWDDNTITSGSGGGAFIEASLASTVSRTNKGKRPILEFKRDIDLFDYGTRYYGTVDVVAATEDFGDIETQPAGLQVDGVTLTPGMRLIFLDPDQIATFLEWDEDPGIANDQWDEAPWEVDGVAGAVTRFVWEVDIVGGNITLNKYDLLNDALGDAAVEIGGSVAVTSGNTWAGYEFYQAYDTDTEEWNWRAGQQKTGVNQPMLYSLYDTSGISLADDLEYPDNDFAGNEIFSYKVLTQERLNELGGGTLINDSILGFPVETKGFRQLGDIIFENDLETNRANYTPVGESETEIRGYYYYRQLTVNESVLANPSFSEGPLRNALIGANYLTNWKTSTVPEEQRVIDRYLTETDDEDTFPVSVRPDGHAGGNNTCLVVAQGRRLNTSEFAYISSTQSVKLFSRPTEYDGKVGTGTKTSFIFDIEENIEITIDGVYQELDVHYYIFDDTPFSINVIFYDPPAAGAFVQATNRVSGAPGANQIVEILTCTEDALPEDSIGYFEIPNALENNPNNLEIQEQSWNEFTPHFTSIITEQDVYEGDAFGAGNNYRDTAKDGSLGTFALQSQSPLLKTMFCISNSDLDIIEAIRFNKEEYTRFRNKYIKTAQQLLNEGFQPFSQANPIDVSEWVDEILRRVTRGREYADAFKDTYMIAWNNVYEEEELTAGGGAAFTTTNFIDLSDKRNVMYVYVDGAIQVIDRDYTITNTNPIQITFDDDAIPAGGASVVIRLYESSAPAHIPATPTKLGLYPSFRPRIETDNTYLVPANVIIGHDGSRTPVYGNEIDDLLLELESRIYNGILDKFRVSVNSGDAGTYTFPIEHDTLKPSKFRDTRWSLTEWNDLIKQSFFKWSASNRTDYITNNYYDASNEWSWNYKTVDDVDGETLPSGYWRGIFDYYYDTQTPESTPWEMLGFTEKPIWWETCSPRPSSEGDLLSDGMTPFTGYGAGPWPADDEMWIDIEAGRIRRVYDPVDGDEFADDPTFYNWGSGYIDERYVRPDLVAKYLPVDSLGALKADPLAAIDVTDSLADPSAAQAADDYSWGDWSPIEYAWRTSESYPFALMEAMFLARPGEFGEKFWDPEHIFEVPVDTAQIVNSEQDLRKRVGNDLLYVHGETVGGVAEINTGYQVWITGRLRTLKKDPSADFGNLLRTIDVKLGHKMAGFTDKDTLRVFVEGISVSSQATNLLVPSENIDVALYTGTPANDYFYGGVLIKALANDTYQIFGYDILKGQFDYYGRNEAIGTTTFNVGGEPEEFRIYENNTTYQAGDIVKLNGIFYRAKETFESDVFDPDEWTKLGSLPVTGGLSGTWKANSNGQLLSLKYGEKLVSTQAVLDFLAGWNDYLVEQGWDFSEIGGNGQVNDWLRVSKDFLLWVGSRWEEGSIIMLSPSGEKAVLNAQEGYPGNVERISNGVYSILNKEGVAIDPANTVINREDRLIEIEPSVAQTGIYGLRVSTYETESILTFDNVTVFNDTIYDPVLGSRLARLDFRGRRTLDWTGKLEAAGFIITADGLLPNYENLVDSIRNYHNTEVQLDRPEVENTARHLIGFDERDYFTDLGVLDDAQFQFYQGLVRQKGTRQAIEKLERNALVTSIDDELNVVEEWALKVGEFGGVCRNQYTEFLISASEVKVDPQLVQLSYPSTSIVGVTKFFDGADFNDGPNTITITAHGFLDGEKKRFTDISQSGTSAVSGLTNDLGYSVIVVDENTIQLAQLASPTVAISFDSSGVSAGDQYSLSTYVDGKVVGVDIVSSPNTYTIAPNVFFTNHPDDTTGSGAIATSVLDTDGTLLRIDMVSQGTGYTEPPTVTIGSPSLIAGADRAVARIRFDIDTDITSDDIIIIDIDDETRWITKPSGPACDVAAELWPEAPEETYRTTNAGYVHKDDITFTAFNRSAVDNIINNTTTAFAHGQTIWIARDPRETFGVYFMDNYRASTIDAQDETYFDGSNNNGTFFGGSNYAVSERIFMSDGTQILVDAISGGVVTEFTIDIPSTSSFPARGSYTLTAVSSNIAGNNDFTLTVGTANEQSGAALSTNVARSSITMTGDGTATLTSLPREDVIKAQFEIGVSGTPAGDVTSVSVVDGGFGYKSGGTFTISRNTHGAERDENEEDAVITYTVSNGQVDGATVTTAGSGYSRNVSQASVNATGSGYNIGDVLTVSGGTPVSGGTSATLDVVELSTVASQDETSFDASPANEGTFVAGTGHAVGDVITMSDGSTVTVDAASISTIRLQTEADFNGAGGNGTHNGISATAVDGDIITMSDGTVVQVTAAGAPATGPAAITAFKIIETTTATNIGTGETITQVSTSGYGIGFSITLGTNNEQSTATTGIISQFTVTTASTSGITENNTTLTQTSTTGFGSGFALNMGQGNQGVFDITINDPGAYTIDPSTTAAATTVAPVGGTGCTVDLTIFGTTIPVDSGDIPNPIGWGRYLGNSTPNSGSIFANGKLYDYTITSGLNVSLTKDGVAVEQGDIPNNTPFYTLMNVRFEDIAERTLFETVMEFAGVSKVWTDDNGSGSWEVSNVTWSQSQTAYTYTITIETTGTDDYGYSQFGGYTIVPDPPLIAGANGEITEFTEVTSYDTTGIEFWFQVGGPGTDPLTVMPYELYNTVELDYSGGTLVLNTADVGAGGDMNHSLSTQPAGGGSWWFPGFAQIWTVGDVGSTYDVRFNTVTNVYSAARTESELIETWKFENAYVYEEETKDTLAQIPVYDPFKGILPGNVAQNIKYIRQGDPARYTNASESRLIDEDLAFDGDQIGELWWDTSTSAYLLYEQGTDTYRRDNWGKLFPGSSVDIYEWTRHTGTPDTWDGDGTVRNTTDYVQLQEWDPILEEVRTFYYFWVKNRTEVPGGVNRTVAGFEVANIISNPVANLYQWFSPVSQSGFVFAGVDNVFTDSDNIFQINYRRDDTERPLHVEWELGRDGDTAYEINDIHWTKMVDSLCGFTDEMDITADFYTDLIATFNTDSSGIDGAIGQEIITTLEPHGFSDGAGVVYSKNGGSATIGLTEGTMYYVEVISATEVALHPTSHFADPPSGVPANPASRVNLTTSGAEQHTLREHTTAVNNFANAIPTAGDASRGYLIVPDPALSETQKLGIRTRPMQSMFSDILAARRVWRDKVNELTNDIILRDVAPTWNASLTTNNLWEWVDWYADGYDATNTVPVRQVDDTSDLAFLTDPIDGDIVKVTGTRFSIYEYDAETDIYTLVAREASRLNILSDVYTSDPTLEIAIEIRDIINALEQNVFVGDISVYSNIIFFAMLNYVFSEQDDLDWAFKTTYIFLDQTGRTLEQDRVFQEDPFDAALQYITEAKPYHSKVRDFRITRRTAIDNATGTASENHRVYNNTILPYDMTVNLVYDQIRGGNLSVTEMRIAKYMMSQDSSWDGYISHDVLPTPAWQTTQLTPADLTAAGLVPGTDFLWDINGSYVKVRLGAAGRAVNNYRDSLADIQAPTGGVAAEIEVIMALGELSAVNIISGGSGYTDVIGATFNLSNTAGGGSPAGSASIQYTVEGGSIVSVTPAATGNGYTNGTFTVDALDMPLTNVGTTIREFDPVYNGAAVTEAELEAISTINAAITEEFYYDFQGVFLRNTSFGGLPTLESFALVLNTEASSASGTGYAVGEIISLDAGSGVPVSNALFRVETITGSGGITSLSLVSGGSYTQTPTVDPVNLNGGSGSGAQVTTLIFENGDAVPFDTTPWDQIGFESSPDDTAVTTLTGSPDGFATTIPGQTAGDYDGTGENGSFVAGVSYSVGSANGGVPYAGGLVWAENGVTGDTITRSSGNSFVTTDGIEPGMQIIVSNAADTSNNGTYTIASVTDTVITLEASSGTIETAGNPDTTATFTFHDIITMSDGTDVRVDAVDGSGGVTAFTIINGSSSYLPLDSTITQLSVSGNTGSDFQLTLGDANETSGSFADIPAEETFSGNGSTKEFTLTSSTPTYFMFVVVNGIEQVLNVDYFFIGSKLVFVSILESDGSRSFGAPPAGTDNIEIYTYIEAGDLINPQVTAGISEEMVPLDPRENLVLIADTHNVTLSSGGTGYSVGDVLTVVGGTATTAMTLVVQKVTGGVIDADGIAIIQSGDYTVLPGAGAATTVAPAGGTGATVDVTQPSYSFRLHNDTLNNLIFSRNSEASSTTLRASIGLTDSVIPVAQGENLYTTAPSRTEPQIAWIGTERIVYHGVTATKEATFTIDTDGAGTVSAVALVSGGTGYTDGTGFTFTVTTATGIAGNDDAIIAYDVAGGVVTNPTVSVAGTGYTISQTGVAVVAADTNDPDVAVWELTGVIRGTSGTHAQTALVGTKVYDGGSDQDIPVTPYIYWVNSASTNYASGTNGQWRYTGDNAHFSDAADPDWVTTNSILVGDTLRVTSGTVINNSYFVSEIITKGEVCIIDITTPGTGYSVGDTINLAGIGGALGATAEVGGVDVNGGITYVRITNRGTAGTLSATTVNVTSGDGNAVIDVFFNIEGLVLAWTGEIIDPSGVVVERDIQSWEVDSKLAGGLVAATTAAATFLSAEPGDALTLPAP